MFGGGPMPSTVKLDNGDGTVSTIVIHNCPYCGCAENFCIAAHVGEGWYVTCGDDKCDARGPIRISPVNAIDMWNGLSLKAHEFVCHHCGKTKRMLAQRMLCAVCYVMLSRAKGSVIVDVCEGCERTTGCDECPFGPGTADDQPGSHLEQGQ